MSVNKFMHPRNKYRKPPDFKALAIKYPEFRKYAKQDISGKVRLNFKDLEAIRTLTYTLLKEDFDLDVEIPKTRLIPTLPLRLNYLLWIEDILESNGKSASSGGVKGIDIGCGASCVYPLLAAKKFRWNMLATESDTESAFIASRNVRKNKLQDMISVRSVMEDVLLDGVLRPNTVYDFCMCNPPFFSSTEELDPVNVSRSPNRPPPRNAHSGSPAELVFTGGETAFIERIIQDSVKLKESVRICTVMVGHKTSMGKVKQTLTETGVTKIITTEFCQGHTTRWGVAWTLDPTVVLREAKDMSMSHKKKTAFTVTFELDLPTTVERLRQLMAELKITFSTLKSNQELCVMQITALSRTWSSSRKKKRQEKLKQMSLKNEDNEKSKTGTEESCGQENEEKNSEVSEVKVVACEKINMNNETTKAETDSIPDIENQIKSTIYVEKNLEDSECKTEESCGQENEESNSEVSEAKIVACKEINGNNKTTKSEIDSIPDVEKQIKSTINVEKNLEDSECNTGNKRSWSEDAGCSELNSPKKLKMENSTSELKSNRKEEPFLRGSLVVGTSSQGSVVELLWLRGSGGKDAAHQVLQYFKNNLKTH